MDGNTKMQMLTCVRKIVNTKGNMNYKIYLYTQYHSQLLTVKKEKEI